MLEQKWLPIWQPFLCQVPGLKVFQKNGQSQHNKASQDKPEGILRQHGNNAQLGEYAPFSARTCTF